MSFYSKIIKILSIHIFCGFTVHCVDFSKFRVRIRELNELKNFYEQDYRCPSDLMQDAVNKVYLRGTEDVPRDLRFLFLKVFCFMRNYEKHIIPLNAFKSNFDDIFQNLIKNVSLIVRRSEEQMYSMVLFKIKDNIHELVSRGLEHDREESYKHSGISIITESLLNETILDLGFDNVTDSLKMLYKGLIMGINSSHIDSFEIQKITKSLAREIGEISGTFKSFSSANNKGIYSINDTFNVFVKLLKYEPINFSFSHPYFHNKNFSDYSQEHIDSFSEYENFTKVLRLKGLFGNIVADLLDGFKSIFVSVLKFSISVFQPFIESLLKFFLSLISEFLREWIPVIAATFVSLLKSLEEFIDQVLDFLSTFFSIIVLLFLKLENKYYLFESLLLYCTVRFYSGADSIAIIFTFMTFVTLGFRRHYDSVYLALFEF